MKKITTILLFLMLALTLPAAESVTSPDGRLCFTLEQKDGLFYTITRDGKELISRSPLGVAIDNHLLESALGIPNEKNTYWGANWCRNLRQTGCERLTKDTTWAAPYGEWDRMRDHYNELTVHFMKRTQQEVKGDGYDKAKCYYMDIKVRAYDEGIAFRYELPETSNGLFVNMKDELTEFHLPSGSEALCTSWAQGTYQWRDISKAWEEQAERPLTIRLPKGGCLSLLEAGCVDYVRTKFALVGGNVVKACPYEGLEVMTPFATSWRLVMVGDKMTDLCNHDYMVLNLNDAQAKCAPKGSSMMTEGWGWIEPGKVFRSDLNREAICRAVDFAAKHHLQYVHLDAGWYGPEMKMESSALTMGEGKDFTIREAAQIAAAKGVGLLVYVNQRALYKELDPLLDSLEAWGVRGVKFGFVQVGNQQWTTWLHEAVRKCADHHLMVDIHDEYRPTGYSRTYPNLMTAEGIAGNEEMPTATHNVTLPFCRFLCGPADYTLCYFNGRVKTTYAHQLAMAAVYYSPLTWMYWYDIPAQEHGEGELEFWDRIPTSWDDTKVLQGEPGEYVVTARRAGKTWFVGAMNGGEPVLNEKGGVVRTPADAKATRTITLPLNFLEKDVRYTAHLYEDDPTLDTRTKVRVSTKEVTANDVQKLPLLPSGGAAIWLEAHTLADRPALNVETQLKYCDAQVKKALKKLHDNTMEARNIRLTERSWNCRKACPEEWCSGFWPGVLWMDYETTGDLGVKKAAVAFTKSIMDSITARPVFDHDLGFITINSLIKGIEATENSPSDASLNAQYKACARKAATELATLYNPTVGTLLSWPRHVKDFGGHNTIMDNMINLELLYWAEATLGRLGGLATRHAETTMANHFRPDGSCYHVAVYDTITGKLKYCQTHQGYADYSMWSRGQSWAIYGYTMVYRYTHDERFLRFAQKVTDVYLTRLHETSDDWVPLWDMDARWTKADEGCSTDGTYHGIPKDASTAAVVASALLELSEYVGSEKASHYRQCAINMLADLSTKRYLSGSKNDALLMHSTGNHPANSEIDASIIYADYYYMEALQRLAKLSSRR